MSRDDRKRHSPPPTTHAIASTNAGKIEAHVFEPRCDNVSGSIVTVHPWAALGGGEHNTVGLARCIATAASGPHRSARKEGTGWRVVTFELKSSNAIWGICSAHADEVQQTVDVVSWVNEHYGGETVLLGSSAGAPIAGTAMERLLQQLHAKNDALRRISAYVAVGYTFGNFAWLGFGRHFASVVGNSASPPSEGAPPKLFVMGEKDEFTSVDQLRRAARRMEAHGRVSVEIVAGVGHFKLESSNYDQLVANVVLKWLSQVLA